MSRGSGERFTPGAARLGLGAVVAVLGWACEKDAAPTGPPRVFPTLTEPAPVLECNFDLASRVSEVPGQGFQMCYPRPGGQSWTPPPVLALDAGVEAGPADALAPEGGAKPAPQPCPAGMVLVDGMYCPEVKHTCLKAVEVGGILVGQRCAKYGEPKCVGERERRRFCIDRDEFAPDGQAVPLVDQSWTMGKNTCESLGKRLCFGSEWEFACEGEEMRPYPYGYVRDTKICNHDRKNLSIGGKLRDLRVPSDERPNCLSPFGVRNLVGNVDEWTFRDGMARPFRSGLRGGWWLAGRNNCRAQTTAHDEVYFGPQTGFRCCRDASF